MNDNELIAEFMGAKFKNCGSYSVYSFDDFKTQTFVSVLQYDTSWDWLMPVVEKISQDIEGVSYAITPNLCTVQDFSHPVKPQVFSGTGETIQAVYRATVDFIKWYNEQK